MGIGAWHLLDMNLKVKALYCRNAPRSGGGGERGGGGALRGRHQLSSDAGGAGERVPVLGRVVAVAGDAPLFAPREPDLHLVGSVACALALDEPPMRGLVAGTAQPLRAQLRGAAAPGGLCVTPGAADGLRLLRDLGAA
jgi:hypothetical protein